MHVTVEDIEALKELSDELEEDHVETECSLQREIGMLSALCDFLYCTDCHPQNLRIPTYKS